jgi:hypothetical protein
MGRFPGAADAKIRPAANKLVGPGVLPHGQFLSPAGVAVLFVSPVLAGFMLL